MEKNARIKRMQNIAASMSDDRKRRGQRLEGELCKRLKLLLFWPIFGLLFRFVERDYAVEEYVTVYCRLDDMIPFCEIFLLPYLFWFLYLFIMHVYSFFYEPELFDKFMKFVIITYTVTIVIYFLFPNCQQLRPTDFVRNNVLTRFMERYYAFDTDTNVCPSLHVIGSVAVMFAGFHSKQLKGIGWKSSFLLTAVSIFISTVF